LAELVILYEVVLGSSLVKVVTNIPCKILVAQQHCFSELHYHIAINHFLSFMLFKKHYLYFYIIFVLFLAPACILGVNSSKASIYLML